MRFIIYGWLLTLGAPHVQAQPDHSLVRFLHDALERSPTPAAVIDGLPKLQAALRLRGRELGTVERLVALAPDGSVLGAVTGNEHGVVLGVDFDRPLLQPNARLMLIHNHPSGTSLSGADIAQLVKAGVDSIVALGHDGSVYLAAHGSQYDATALDTWLYPLARSEMAKQLQVDRPRFDVRSETLDALFEHLVVTSLHKAEAIRYAALLGPARAGALRACVPLCGRATEAVAARLRIERQHR